LTPDSLKAESKSKNEVVAIDLSVILPVMNEGENLRVLLPRMRGKPVSPKRVVTTC
jgi:hypothetical protein